MKTLISTRRGNSAFTLKHAIGLRSHATITHSYKFSNTLRHLQQGSHNSRGVLQIVCTSEHWWEEEEEFDSLTDALKPKQLVLIVPSANSGAHETEINKLKDYLQPAHFTVGFCSSEVS